MDDRSVRVVAKLNVVETNLPRDLANGLTAFLPSDCLVRLINKAKDSLTGGYDRLDQAGQIGDLGDRLVELTNILRESLDIANL